MLKSYWDTRFSFLHFRVKKIECIYSRQKLVFIHMKGRKEILTRERKGQTLVCSWENSRAYLRCTKDSVTSVCAQGIWLSLSWWGWECWVGRGEWVAVSLWFGGSLIITTTRGMLFYNVHKSSETSGPGSVWAEGMYWGIYATLYELKVCYMSIGRP